MEKNCTRSENRIEQKKKSTTEGILEMENLGKKIGTKTQASPIEFKSSSTDNTMREIDVQ